MHCPWQHIVPGKVMTPLDAYMDEALARYAAKQKLDRVASYRQIQGYSNQLRVMTRYCQPRVTIKSFELPPGFNVRPIKGNEGRKTERGEHQDVSYIVDKETGTRTPILPPVRQPVRMLTLGLDQGSIGSAGCAFLMFFLHYMVFCKFDKIHRLIRDIKGAENGCCQKIFTKTKLWSAYLFSLNKRPFGSGANTTLKQRFLQVFKLQITINHAVFRKYCPKLGKVWKMPYGTASEQQAILDKVHELPSYTNHGSHPKLANWFAWNKSAEEQIPEFWGSKMILESQLFGDTDPDTRLQHNNVFVLIVCHVGFRKL